MGQFLTISPPASFHFSNLELNQAPKWIRRRVQFTDFSTAATTANLDSLQADPWTKFPGGVVIHGAFIALVTEFAGGSVSAATLSVGTTSSATAYVGASNVFTGAGAFKTYNGATLTPGTFLNASSPLGAGTVRVQLVTTTANANALTAGKADIFMLMSAPSIKSS